MKNIPKITPDLIIEKCEITFSSRGTLTFMARYGYDFAYIESTRKPYHDLTHYSHKGYKKFIESLPKEKIEKMYFELLKSKHRKNENG